MTLPLLSDPAADADSVNFNFDVIARQFPLGQENLALALLQTLFQVGDLKATAVATPPTGWLLCDGTSYLRADYPNLFAAIGTTFGAVDGTHFNAPDYRGRALVGIGTHADVNALTDNDGLAVASRTPKHTHHKATFGTGARQDFDPAVPPRGFRVAAGVAEYVATQANYEAHFHNTGDFDTDSATPAYQTAYILIKT